MQPERPEHEPEPELQRALDAWQPEPARAAFREELRGLFLDAGSTSADESVAVAVAPELAEALDTYAPKARNEFRDRLRADFLSGTVSSAGPESGEDVSAPRGPHAQHGRWRPLILLAAAAALVLWILRPVDPSWSIDPNGFVAAGLTIDDRVLSEDVPLSEVVSLLSTAQKVRTSANSLRLVLGDLFVVEMAESSILDLSRMPKDLRRGDLVLYGIEGGFRVATGPKFKAPQRTLRFETDDVDVNVVGTIFGVDLFPKFTCVCCLEGNVTTTLKTGAVGVGPVEERSTNIIHKSGKPVVETLFEPHMMRLKTLEGFWGR